MISYVHNIIVFTIYKNTMDIFLSGGDYWLTLNNLSMDKT